MDILKYCVLTWKQLVLILVAEFVAIVLHNLVSAALGIEEALFFILAVFVIPLILVFCVAYTVVRYTVKYLKSKRS